MIPPSLLQAGPHTKCFEWMLTTLNSRKACSQETEAKQMTSWRARSEYTAHTTRDVSILKSVQLRRQPFASPLLNGVSLYIRYGWQMQGNLRACAYCMPRKISTQPLDDGVPAAMMVEHAISFAALHCVHTVISAARQSCGNMHCWSTHHEFMSQATLDRYHRPDGITRGLLRIFQESAQHRVMMQVALQPYRLHVQGCTSFLQVHPRLLPCHVCRCSTCMSPHHTCQQLPSRTSSLSLMAHLTTAACSFLEGKLKMSPQS